MLIKKIINQLNKVTICISASRITGGISTLNVLILIWYSYIYKLYFLLVQSEETDVENTCSVTECLGNKVNKNTKLTQI